MTEVEYAEQFVKNNPSVTEALSCLKPGVQLSVILLGTTGRIYLKNDETVYEPKHAINPDVELTIDSEAIRRLSGFENESLTHIGIEFLKQISSGQIKLKVKSSMTKIATNGYIKVIKAAGPDFMSTLSSYGFSRVGQIMSLLKSLKEK